MLGGRAMEPQRLLLWIDGTKTLQPVFAHAPVDQRRLVCRSECVADKPSASLRRSNWKYDRPDPYGYSILPHVHVNRTHVQWLHAVARR